MMAQSSLASKLLQNVESMIDPNATVDQQLSQMRAQMAALTELPKLIQQKLETVNRQINQISVKESMKREVCQEQRHVDIRQHNQGQSNFARITKPKHSVEITELEPEKDCIEIRVTKPSLTEDELEMLRRDELKKYLEGKVTTRSTPMSPSRHQVSPQLEQKTGSRRKPDAFGQVTKERPLYLPGGRRWKLSEYDENQISEALTAQAEVIKGKAIGVNFKKFEKPPVPLDHLKHSEVFKAVHNTDESLKNVQ